MSQYSAAGKPVDTRFRTFLQGIQPWNVYSQWGEDAILAAIFDKIGTANKWCCEIGAADGLFFSNTRGFIEQGWSAVLIEADMEQVAKCAKLHAGNDRVKCWNSIVVPPGLPTKGSVPQATIDRLLARANAPLDLDLLSIDVDGQDYYLFNSLMGFQPRVVVCEYAPDADRMYIPPLNEPGQAGIDAVRYVAEARGYEVVVATKTNLICVRKDLADKLMLDEPGEAPAIGDTVKVAAVMSTPRFGPLSTSDCILSAIARFGIPLVRGEGAWWQHSLTRGIERVREQYGPDLIITIDYDSLFTEKEVGQLVALMVDHPEVDAIVPMQQKREGGELLATSSGEVNIGAALVPISIGHFGLTIFRASLFDRLKKPWFWESPDPNGSWNENRTDADIGFWKNCAEVGARVCLGLDVLVGHGEYVVTWPGQDLRPVYQPMNTWRDAGRPEAAFRRERAGETKAALEMK